jgi:hypothetical protein
MGAVEMELPLLQYTTPDFKDEKMHMYPLRKRTKWTGSECACAVCAVHIHTLRSQLGQKYQPVFLPLYRTNTLYIV